MSVASGVSHGSCRFFAVGVSVCMFRVLKSFGMEQRTMIKCYFKSWKTATEVYQDLKNMYGDDSLSRAQVF